MPKWEEEKKYCKELGMLERTPDVFVVKKQWDTFIQFFDDHWEFWSCGIRVYQSAEDNLSYCLENNSVTFSTCPICGYKNDGTINVDTGCIAFYYEDNDVTLFWNCEKDSSHYAALYGYRLDERNQVKQLQKPLNIDGKGNFSTVEEIRHQLVRIGFKLSEDYKQSQDKRYEIWEIPGKGGWPGGPPESSFYAYVDKYRIRVFFGHESFDQADFMWFPQEEQ